MSRLLDTSALLAHFRNESGAERVQALFEEDGAELLLCSITLPEFARRIHALGASLEETQEIVRRYRHIADEVVAVDAKVAELAFNLIVETPERIPLVDALIAASAQSRGAHLVHRDAHMKAIPSSLLQQTALDEQDGLPA